MKPSLSQAWFHASHIEAQRMRLDAVDVDHLYLGLLGIGGAAARLLGSRGVSLASARERVREALSDDLTSLGVTVPADTLPEPRPALVPGDGPWQDTPRAHALIDGAQKAPDTYALLLALLQEPSGAVRRLVHADGVVPQELAEPLKTGSDDPYSPTNAPVITELLPESGFARRVASFVSAPADQVRAALADPGSLRFYAIDPGSEVSEDGLTTTTSRRGKTMTIRAELTESSDDAVTWVMRLQDTPYAGQVSSYHRFQFTPAPGGTELTHDLGLRTFGKLGRLLRPMTTFFSGFAMTTQRYWVAAHIAEWQGR